MRFDSCLLASDIDGTLMNYGYINPKNIELIDTFSHNGGNFCIATGRCVPAIAHIVGNFKDLRFAIVYNGGMIYDFKKKKAVYERFLEDEDKLFFKTVYESIPELGIEVYCGEDIYLLRNSEPCQAHCDYEYLKPRRVTFDEIKDLKWNKAMCVYRSDFPAELIETIIEKFPSKNCDYVKANFTTQSVTYGGYEQLPGGANKGTALTELKKILCIPQGKAFAIGDYYNDVQMLAAADISACPAGSPEDIKNTVDFVGGACDDGAVADFIEYLMTVDL